LLTRKIAYIDLDKGTVTQEEVPLEWRQKYIGARGINNWLLYSLVDSSIDPLGPENPLIIGAGLLTGAPGFGTARFNICAVSPECGNVGDSNCGGQFGPEMKYAGFDHLLIRGKASSPVYLFIQNDKIDIRDAGHLWGKDTWETQLALQEELRDERVRAIAIGPAGENLVRMANIITGPKDAAGRTGMGAVMGSKNLKAIAARGTKDLTFAHPKELLTYFREQTDLLMTRKWIKAMSRLGTPLLVAPANEGGWLTAHNDQRAIPTEKGRLLYGENLEKYSLGMAACRGCPVHCRHRYLVTEGPFNGTRGEGPEYGCIGPFGINQEIVDFGFIMYANHLCNRLGMDVGIGSMIGFAMELYQRGIIDDDITRRPLRWGNEDDIISLLVDIAYRRGFGDVLAEGPYALKQLPEEASKYLLTIKNTHVGGPGGRVVKSFSLAQAVASLPGHAHRNRPGLDVLRLPPELLEKIYGGPVSTDYRSYEGKSRMVWWHEILYAICDSLGCCRFQTVFNSPNSPKYEEYSELIRLTTGLELSVEELREIGERIYTVERLLLGKLGVGDRKDDTLPERWFKEAVEGGTSSGEVIDRDKFEQFLDEYYAFHGWDNDGHPTPEGIEKLGIAPAQV
jgi:aldehyde:ferredoxin oxidoreductase